MFSVLHESCMNKKKSETDVDLFHIFTFVDGLYFQVFDILAMDGVDNLNRGLRKKLKLKKWHLPNEVGSSIIY